MLRAKTTQNLENKAGARFTGLKNLPLKSKISMVVLGIVVLAAVCAPLIAPRSNHHPASIHLAPIPLAAISYRASSTGRVPRC